MSFCLILVMASEFGCCCSFLKRISYHLDKSRGSRNFLACIMILIVFLASFSTLVSIQFSPLFEHFIFKGLVQSLYCCLIWSYFFACSLFLPFLEQNSSSVMIHPFLLRWTKQPQHHHHHQVFITKRVKLRISGTILRWKNQIHFLLWLLKDFHVFIQRWVYSFLSHHSSLVYHMGVDSISLFQTVYGSDSQEEKVKPKVISEIDPCISKTQLNHVSPSSSWSITSCHLKFMNFYDHVVRVTIKRRNEKFWWETLVQQIHQSM